MITTLRSGRELLFAGALGVGGGSLILGLAQYTELQEYKNTARQTSVEVTGIAEFQRNSLLLKSGKQVIMECHISNCGFPGVHQLAGQEILATFKAGAIHRVEVGARVIDTFSIEVQRRINSLLWLACAFCVSVVALVAKYLGRTKAPNPSFHRTASGGR